MMLLDDDGRDGSVICFNRRPFEIHVAHEEIGVQIAFPANGIEPLR